MIDLKFGFNFSFKRDKSKDAMVDLLLKDKLGKNGLLDKPLDSGSSKPIVRK